MASAQSRDLNPPAEVRMDQEIATPSTPLHSAQGRNDSVPCKPAPEERTSPTACFLPKILFLGLTFEIYHPK